MSNTTVITLHGDSGSGKDSTYLALKKINPYLQRYSFGDQIRSELQAERKNYPEDERSVSCVSGYSFKDRMIQHGRQMMLVDPYWYTRTTVEDIELLGTINPLVIVTDCRRPCELSVIRSEFRTISFRCQHYGSVVKSLDHLLRSNCHIMSMPEQSIEKNVEFILNELLRIN